MRVFLSDKPVPIRIPELDEGEKRKATYWMIPMAGRNMALYQNRQEYLRIEIKEAAVEQTVETIDEITNRQQDQMTELFVTHIPKIQDVWYGEDWREEITERVERRKFFDAMGLIERSLFLALLMSGGKLQAYTFPGDSVDGAAKRKRSGGKGRNKGTHGRG